MTPIKRFNEKIVRIIRVKIFNITYIKLPDILLVVIIIESIVPDGNNKHGCSALLTKRIVCFKLLKITEQSNRKEINMQISR